MIKGYGGRELEKQEGNLVIKEQHQSY